MSENINRPGLPNYTGPKEGYFYAVHHDLLFEWSDDIDERLNYVDYNKRRHEIPIRREQMLYLDPTLCPAVLKLKPLDDDHSAKLKLLDDDYWAKRKPLDDDYWAKLKPLYDDYSAKLELLDDDYWAKRKPLEDEVLAYVKSVLGDECRWNGTEIDFK